MSGLVIFGAGQKGRVLKRLLDSKYICVNNIPQKIYYFCDNYRPEGSYVEGVEVINPSSLIKEATPPDILISSDKIVDDAVRQLHEMRYKGNVWYVPDYVYRFRWNEDNLPFSVKLDINKPRLPWLEYMVVDHCNLNCRGCFALSNVSKQNFMRPEDFEKDLVQIRKYYTGVKILKLLGGEPLLHPNLTDFITIARSYFKDAELVVHSNGLLVPQMENKVLDVMYKNDCGFIFTLYPPTGRFKRSIEQVLDRVNVRYTFTDPVYEFRKYINIRGDYDAEEVFKNCRTCLLLKNGVLSCGTDWFVDSLEKMYGKRFILEEYNRHCVDIYNTEMNGWQINSYLNQSYDLCKYCGMRSNDPNDYENVFFPWTTNGIVSENDWIIKA